jgi:hypothetical protein
MTFGIRAASHVQNLDFPLSPGNDDLQQNQDPYQKPLCFICIYILARAGKGKVICSRILFRIFLNKAERGGMMGNGENGKFGL